MGLTFQVVPAGVDETLPERISPVDSVDSVDPISPVDSVDPIGPIDGARILASRKAQFVAAAMPGAIVIGADTVVVCAGQVLGKPADAEEARQMLRLLSGRRHEVVSGLAVVCPKSLVNQDVDDISVVALPDAGGKGASSQILEAHEVTSVYFRELSERDIAAYIASGEPFDKAGAYGIQGRAGVFVSRIEGCYFNIVGLPVPMLARLLSACGILLP